MTGLSPARTTRDLGSVRSEEVWIEDFETPDQRLSVGGDCRHVFDDQRGAFVLACRNEGNARAVIAIDSETYYRVRVSAMQSRHRGYRIAVTEHDAEVALRIFQVSGLGESWGNHEVLIYTASSAQFLEINVDSRHTKARLWLDEIEIDRLILTEEQELRILMGKQPHPQILDPPGLVQRGRLLPLCDPGDEKSVLQDNYAVRDAIFAPPPTDIHFPLRVTRDARLSLAFGLSEDSSPETEVRFRVVASESNGAPRVLLDETLTRSSEAEGGRWHERRVSLSKLSGREVRLTLETRATNDKGLASPLWANPEIHIPRTAEETPNIILIAVDTLRADRLSCYGHRPEVSTEIDALASDGVRFDQAISSANWTSPSFVSLFSGRTVPDLPDTLSSVKETVLAEHLQRSGYATAAIAYKPNLFDKGFDRGFDYYFNSPRYAIRAEDNVSRALRWLNENEDRRFFMFLHLNDPHQPFCQPEDAANVEVVRRLGSFGLRLPIMVKSREAMAVDLRYPAGIPVRSERCRSCLDGRLLSRRFKELARDVYDNAITYTDRNVGELISYLKEKGLYETSVIAFVSDHGETLWDHGEQFAHGGDNLHDELIRVPLIIKAPRTDDWAMGRSVAGQVRLFDVFPTLLEFAGVKPPPTPAKSLLPYVRARAARGKEDRPAFSGSRRNDVFSLRSDGWKYIRYYGHPRHDGLFERLYDLKRDPKEKENLAEVEAQTLEKMRLTMDEQLLAFGAGRIVLIKGERGTDYRIRLRWNGESQLGLFPQPGLTKRTTAEQEFWEYSTTSSREVVLLTSFWTTEDAHLEVEIEAAGKSEFREVFGPDNMPDYVPGVLADILRARGVQIRVFTGRNVPALDGAQEETIDARNLRNLKELGYVQ